MSDKSLSSSGFYLKTSVSNAERIIIRKGGTVSSGKVIAEQSFGFWTSLFEPHHYRLIGGVVIRCFPNKIASANRSVISKKLNRIRTFRNRIYHNEPICFNGRGVDFSNAEKIENEIYELLNWIDPELATYCDYFNGISAKIATADNLQQCI